CCPRAQSPPQIPRPRPPGANGNSVGWTLWKTATVGCAEPGGPPRGRVPRPPSSPLAAERNHRRRLVGNKSFNIRPPSVKRGAFLIGKFVFLIDADDTRETAARMVQNFFNHREIDAEFRQAGGDRAPNIVEAPRRHIRG